MGRRLRYADENAILKACETDQKDLVESLIADGVPMEDVDLWGDTLLHIACRMGALAVATLLLDRSAPLEAKNNSGGTPLLLASGHGHFSVVEMLLNRGALIEVYDEDGNTPFLKACRKGDPGVCKLLINRGAKIDSYERPLDLWWGPSYGHPLGEACTHGHQDVVELLLDQGAPIDGSPMAGCPLSYACRAGHIDVVKLLLAREAYLDNLNSKDGPWSLPPIVFACQGGHMNIVKLLMSEGATFEPHLGVHALWHACYDGNIDVLRWLVSMKTPLDSPKGNRESLLRTACQCGHREIVELLLTLGADINGHDRDGKTPLYEACDKGRLGIVELLLLKGADVNGEITSRDTPLFVACKNGHGDIVDLLVRKGADLNRPGIVCASSRHIRVTPLELIFSKPGVKPVWYSSEIQWRIVCSLFSGRTKPRTPIEWPDHFSPFMRLTVLHFPIITLFELLWMTLRVDRARFRDLSMKSFPMADATELRLHKVIKLILTHRLPWTILQEILLKTPIAQTCNMSTKMLE